MSSALLFLTLFFDQTYAAESITLEQAMDFAEKNLISVKIAEAGVEESNQKENQSMANLGPRVDLDANQVWISDKVNKAVGQTLGTTTVPKEVRTVSVTLAQPIISLGPLFMKVRADALNTAISAREHVQSKADARYLGAEAFLRAQKATELEQVVTRSFSVVEKQFGDGKALERAGKISSADVLRLELAVTDAQTQVVQAKAGKDLAFIALAETLGVEVKEIQPFKGGPGADVTVPNLDESVQKASQGRPEFFAADSRIQIAKYYKLASDFDYIPSLNAFAKYERDLLATDLKLPAPANTVLYPKKDIQDKFSYGLSLKWNIIDWGGRYFRSQEFGATLQKAELAKSGVQSKVRLEVAQSLLELSSAKEILKSAIVAERLAAEAARQISLRFSNGQVSTADVISSERDDSRAKANLANARADLEIAYLKYQKTIGEKPTVRK